MKSNTIVLAVGQPGDALPTVKGGLLTLLLVKALAANTIATFPTDPVKFVFEPVESAATGRLAPTEAFVVPALIKKYCRGASVTFGSDAIKVKVPVPVAAYCTENPDRLMDTVPRLKISM